MHPERAARFLATLGGMLLLLVMILRGISLSLAFEETPGGPSRPPEAQPVQYSFTFSEDGQLVIFWQGLAPANTAGDANDGGWYSMDREGGPVLPEAPPEEPDIRPFILRDEQLFLLVGEGVSLATGSPAGMLVINAALSPDGESMAFTAAFPGSPRQLYILNTSEQLDWLGEVEGIGELAWSPDGEQLVFIAPVDGISQLFRIGRSGEDLQQLTFDETDKHSLLWLADGLGIAYIGVEESAPASVDIYWVAGDGQGQNRLTTDGQVKFDLAAAARGQEIAYTVQPEGQPEGYHHLYVIDPRSAEQRRVFPPYSIESLHCPEKIARGSTQDVQFELANSSLLSAGVPVILRSGQQELSVLVEERQADAVRVETVDVPAGANQAVTWQVRSESGLTTHVSVLIDLGEHFPMAERHCVISNTYLGLPNLSFLPAVLPLSAAGMLLTIPWLRHRKKRWLWALWLAYPLIVILLIWIEAARVQAPDTLLTLFYGFLNTL